MMEQDDTGTLSPERGGVVTARGTAEGLVIRLDGRVERDNLRVALNEFLTSRKAFLSGHEVLLEWVGSKPEAGFIEELSKSLQEDFKINIKSSRLREQIRIGFGDEEVGGEAEPERKDPRGNKGFTLFDGIEAIRRGSEAADEFDEKGRYATDASLWDDPDARIVYATLRSGQKIETEHSLVVFGDVNSGAEIIAGGNIIVLGTLRGVAHAGAYDETGGGRAIFALKLQPTQLRIGMVISRGSTEHGSVPEIARVEGNIIAVEPYNGRGGKNKRRD